MVKPPAAQKSAWNVAWITGASSGIGRELAVRLAASGVKVAASARSAEKLAELEAAHPGIRAYPLDVTDPAASRATAAAIEAELGPIDLAVLNAGVWIPMDAETFEPAGIAEGMAVNFTGIVNGLAPLIPAMTARGSGHIAVMASVAGYRGLPVAVAYAPAKAAVIALAESLHLDLADKGVVLSVINPGFVDTPMTKVNTFPMPFLITTEDATRRILRGLEARRFEIVFPWRMWFVASLFRMLPHAFYFALLRRMPAGHERMTDAGPKPKT